MKTEGNKHEVRSAGRKAGIFFFLVFAGYTTKAAREIGRRV